MCIYIHTELQEAIIKKGKIVETKSGAQTNQFKETLNLILPSMSKN